MKRLIALVLAVAMAAAVLAACAVQKPEPLVLGDVSFVSATGYGDHAGMSVVEDKDAVQELVRIYNSLSYVEIPDGSDPDIMSRDLYTIHYHDANGKELVTCYLCPDGYVKFSKWINLTFKLTESFDEDALIKLLEENNKYK